MMDLIIVILATVVGALSYRLRGSDLLRNTFGRLQCSVVFAGGAWILAGGSLDDRTIGATLLSAGLFYVGLCLGHAAHQGAGIYTKNGGSTSELLTRPWLAIWPYDAANGLQQGAMMSWIGFVRGLLLWLPVAILVDPAQGFGVMLGLALMGPAYRIGWKLWRWQSWLTYRQWDWRWLASPLAFCELLSGAFAGLVGALAAVSG